MLRNAIKIGVLTLLLLLASKAYVALMTYQSLSELKESYKESFLLRYQWISTDLNGTLSIEAIEFTPYTLKRTVYINRIDIKFDNYLALLTSLSEFLSGNFSAVRSLSMPAIESELKGRSLNEWLAAEFSDLWLKPLGFYACGDQPFLSAEQFRAMGISKFQGALSVDFSRDDAQQDQVSLSVNLNELGRFQLITHWQDSSFSHAQISKDFSGLSLGAVSFMHQEAGFFRRLNVLCNPLENKDRNIFSAFSASAWEQAMHRQGIMVNSSMVDLYREYLLQGGEISFDASFEKTFKLATYKSLLDQELFDYFNATLRLNGKPVLKPEVYINSQILFPPPPPPAEDKQAHKKPEWEPAYLQTPLEYVESYIGQKVRVLMKDQKSYEGQLTGVTEYNLEVSQNLPGGRVNYPLMLNAIEIVEIWFNAKPQGLPAE